MSILFSAHAALLNSSCSSRTNLYAPDTQNLVPCLNKKYSLIGVVALEKLLYRVLKENTCSNPIVLTGLRV